MTDEIPIWAKDYKPRQNAPKPQETVIATPIDINDPAALRQLAKSVLVEIVQTAPRNVSLVAAIRELLDRVDGKPLQSVQTTGVVDNNFNLVVRFVGKDGMVINNAPEMITVTE